METLETFTQLPLTIDPATKALTSSDPTLTADLADLTKLHRLFLALETPSQVPPPPVPVQPKRSVQITKLRESGNLAYKRASFPDAVKMYDLAIRMASDRPPWEASGLVREELAGLYNNRAQAFMAQKMWAEGSVDAECSVEVKRVGNVKAWWRRGQCLREMGRFEEAAEWIKGGLEFERAGPDAASVGELESLEREVTKVLSGKGAIEGANE